ncbi:MAG: hypothetical protein IPH52_27945 [Leptospiraceae bacterium]|nr:hypothetical protein [Leptospiraceae bacterium]
MSAKFSKGGFRFQTVNWQYQQGRGHLETGQSKLIATKEDWIQENLILEI